MKVLEYSERVLEQSGPVHPAVLPRLHSQEDVLCDREMRTQRKFLMDVCYVALAVFCRPPGRYG